MDLQNNRIPIRITPDRLTNTVVAISIEDKFSTSYLEGKIVSAYNRRHPELPLEKLKLNISQQNGEEQFFYANRLFRVIFKRGLIAFNIVSGYPGWNTYRSWITDFLEDDELILNKIMLQYISEYKDIALFSPEVIDGTINFNHVQDFAGTELQYRCHVHDFDNDRIILGDATVKLTNAAIIQGVDGIFSRIDIRIDSAPFNGSKDDFYRMMDKLHHHEKVLFYSMLSEHFVNSLNPVYD